MIVDGYIDWANRSYPGPPNKTYPTACMQQGLVLHSMEGWMAGSIAELLKPTRSASWTFSLSLAGLLYQHYPLDASTWASGNMEANTRYNALELEGIHTMPINDDQIATLTRLIAELGFGRAELHEHREVWNMATPNAGPTACPSERYAPFYAALEEDMADPRLDAVVAALGGMPAIDAWNLNGNSLLAGYTIEQQKLADHMAAPHVPPAGIPAHMHHTTVTQSTTGGVVV